MKNLFLTVLVMFGLIFAGACKVYALDYPDPDHPPLGPWDVEPPMPPETYEGSWMGSKTFTVPAEGTTISFDYNFLTDEFEEGEPDVNDYFGAALLDPASDYDLLEIYLIADVYGSIFYPITGGHSDGPHGSYFTYETGVLPGAIVIDPAYGGMDVVLAFAVFDLEDPDVDSGVLIDNVSSPVPYGDFSGGLLGPGGFIGQDGEGWDLYGGNVHLLPDPPYLSEVDTTGFEGNYAYLSTGPNTMIPEPATIALLGLGGLLLRKRRDRKQSKK